MNSTNNDLEIDQLIDIFSQKTSVIWKPKINFVRDINLIIEELSKYISFVDIDIYEVLVSCGHNLTWDQEYYVSIEDLNWFKNDDGKKHFFDNLNKNNIINSIEQYRALLSIHSKLIELFELQLQY
jgi:hypothetical protein